MMISPTGLLSASSEGYSTARGEAVTDPRGTGRDDENLPVLFSILKSLVNVPTCSLYRTVRIVMGLLTCPCWEVQFFSGLTL